VIRLKTEEYPADGCPSLYSLIVRRQFAITADDVFESCAYPLDDQNRRGVFSSANGLRNFASVNNRTCLRDLRFRALTSLAFTKFGNPSARQNAARFRPSALAARNALRGTRRGLRRTRSRLGVKPDFVVEQEGRGSRDDVLADDALDGIAIELVSASARNLFWRGQR